MLEALLKRLVTILHLASARKWKSHSGHPQPAQRAEKTLERNGAICSTINLFYSVWYCYFNTCRVASKDQSQSSLCSVVWERAHFSYVKMCVWLARGPHPSLIMRELPFSSLVPITNLCWSPRPPYCLPHSTSHSNVY